MVMRIVVNVIKVNAITSSEHFIVHIYSYMKESGSE